MNLTNKTNLPETYARVVAQYMNYSNHGNDLSVTQLIDSPKLVRLKMRHIDECTEDVSDLFWSMLGTVAHNVLEQHSAVLDMAEERLTLEHEGVKLSGKFDAYHEGVVTDYKLTSVYSVLKESKSDAWEQQLNCYAHLIRQAGYEVHTIQVFAMMRDWQKSKAKYDNEYPQAAVKVIKLKLWEPAFTEQFIKDRIMMHKATFDAPDEFLPDCSDEQMWAQPDTYAVRIGSNKTAYRVFANKSMANDCLDTLTPDRRKVAIIEHRPGKRTRCAEYCLVAPWCQQYKDYVDAQEA